jgi:hypothetical protein
MMRARKRIKYRFRDFLCIYTQKKKMQMSTIMVKNHLSANTSKDPICIDEISLVGVLCPLYYHC